MPVFRPSRRLAAAGTGLLAASALALAAAPAADAQKPLTPVTKASSALTWVRYDEGPSPYSFCKRYPRACELVHQEPVLIPEPDPGPYAFEDLTIPAAQLDLGALDLAQVPGLELGVQP